MRFSVGRVDSHVTVRGEARADSASRESELDKDEVRQLVRQILEEERVRQRRQQPWR